MDNNDVKRKLRILNLEDSQDDCKLIHLSLLREGIECDLVRVETGEDFTAAVRRGGFDLILSDYSLPSFDGFSALKMAKETCPEVPFIFVSGAIGEEVAIETLKQGAKDYVLKDRLARLSTAIRRALLEVEEQTRLRQAETELERYRKHLEELVEERTAELNTVNEKLQLELEERKRLEEKLHAASITDEMTGLLNRRGFLILAQKHLELAERNKKTFAILFLDLNGLKKINDEFGHREGDRTLIDVSNVLKRTFRQADIIARIGGDEFTVLIADVPDKTIEEAVAQHINDNLNAFNSETKRGYKLSVSMGMVYYDPERPCPVEELLDGADELMYEHKNSAYGISSSKGKEIQKRVYERYRTGEHPAELVVRGSHMIWDISLGGISVRTSQRLTKNAIYDIRILGDGDKELSLEGVVVWSSLMRGVPALDQRTPRYEAGLKFIELNEELIKSLEQFMAGLGR
ncbi:MAG: diguanylate cyclase [Nitrospiraceae bacterium]|nr:MAG: diguanylate cyclase [Nitrospiraceae bacterium]